MAEPTETSRWTGRKVTVTTTSQKPSTWATRAHSEPYRSQDGEMVVKIRYPGLRSSPNGIVEFPLFLLSLEATDA